MAKVTISSAGNTMAPALAVLRDLGFDVTRVPGDPALLQADNEHCHLVAEDPLLLLGLATLFAHRGPIWAPSDEEVAAYLSLDGIADGRG